MMAVEVHAGGDRVAASCPGQHIVPVEILVNPARRTPLRKSGNPGDVYVRKIPMTGCPGVRANRSYDSKARFVQESWRKGVRPIEFGEEARIWNHNPVNCTWVRSQLVGIRSEHIVKDAVFGFVNVVVYAEMPLVGIVGQTLGKNSGSDRRQVCWKRRTREEPRIFRLDLRYRENICCGTNCGWRLLEECIGKIVRKVSLHELYKFGRFDCRNLRRRVRRKQPEGATKNEQFVL